ncbi:hypothetical protein NBT05_02660 [Aquimarina sp. ERC-38]|uniref:hypothetical protein n=1 Tax=Aquimarina sp. ERC-38 TaxID=2949996 RepID=UPI002247176F|nr:hypothetical protein [Aquimarina sp. ERC-38]UZO81383.1 hypothetical protein NBT05_02660 [Aquimarina sp. ERC-38]
MQSILNPKNTAMKINPKGFYLVFRPDEYIESFEDVFTDVKSNLNDIKDIFENGVYAPEDIYGLYSSKSEALEDAKVLWDKILKTNKMNGFDNMITPDKKERFARFLNELIQISNKYQLAIPFVEEVVVLNSKYPKTIEYEIDEETGELMAFWDPD